MEKPLGFAAVPGPVAGLRALDGEVPALWACKAGAALPCIPCYHLGSPLSAGDCECSQQAGQPAPHNPRLNSIWEPETCTSNSLLYKNIHRYTVSHTHGIPWAPGNPSGTWYLTELTPAVPWVGCLGRRVPLPPRG